MARAIALSDLDRIVTIEGTAISPDGLEVVFTRVDQYGGERTTSLWRTVSGASPKPLTTGPNDSDPVHLPGGGSLVFRREVRGAPQLFLLALDHGAKPLPITREEEFPGGVGRAEPSPDGTRLAFTAPMNRAGGPRAAPIVVDHLWSCLDGVGWIGAVRHHLFSVSVDGGEARQLTDGDWDAGEPAWSPDGTRLAFTAAADTDADTVLTRSAWVIDAGSAGGVSPPRRAGYARSVSGPVCWTPDGKGVVVAGSSLPRVGNAGLLILDPEGADTDSELTTGLDRNVMTGAPAYPGGRPAFAQGGELLFCIRDRGWTHLYGCDTSDVPSRPRRVFGGPQQVVSGLSVARHVPVAAVVLTTSGSFGEVAVIDLSTGEIEMLTSFTEDALKGVYIATPQEREFTISDGTVVHGWLLGGSGPAGPLLLDIHGGPHNAWSGVADNVHLYQQVLAAHGWHILMLNPRGSDGYGDAFYRAVDGAWGKADLDDLLEPVQQLVAEGVADPHRLAVAGYSYGGFATCEITTRTGRFAAAVAGGLLCDFVPIAASGVYDSFFSRLVAGVQPIDNHAALLAASPIVRVNHVTTPTLILHGTDDQICPVAQADEWFAALRLRGVPTRMVLYPGGSHLFPFTGKPDHRIDYQTRLIAWLIEWLDEDGRD